MDLMIADVVKEMTEGKTAERLAQEDYETTMKESIERSIRIKCDNSGIVQSFYCFCLVLWDSSQIVPRSILDT